MSQFVKQSLVTELCERVDRDLAVYRVALRVAVCGIERLLFDLECLKSPRFVPIGNGLGCVLLALGLREHEPPIPVDEYCSELLLVLLLLLALVLDLDGHAERQSSLTPLDVPAKLLPSLVRSHRAGLDASLLALQQSEHAVSHRVLVELRVSSEDRARFIHCLIEELLPLDFVSVHGVPLFGTC